MSSRSSSPIDRATRLAFAGDLREAEGVLVPTSLPEDGDRDMAAWLRAYLFAATGRFRASERIARRILAVAQEPRLRSRAAVTLGSVLRQGDRHAEARVVEAQAVRRAPTAELRAHLRIGLAADAVGLGELATVDRELSRARAANARGWRVGVRWRWVACERELLAGRPDRAMRWGREALATSTGARARRHEAKSLLFLGVAAREQSFLTAGAHAAQLAGESRRAFRRARTIAEQLGAKPIERVADALLGPSSARR